MEYSHQFELHTPSPLSAVSFGINDQLAVGSG